jgi:hypothetical protein
MSETTLDSRCLFVSAEAAAQVAHQLDAALAEHADDLVKALAQLAGAPFDEDIDPCVESLALRGNELRIVALAGGRGLVLRHAASALFDRGALMMRTDARHEGHRARFVTEDGRTPAVDAATFDARWRALASADGEGWREVQRQAKAPAPPPSATAAWAAASPPDEQGHFDALSTWCRDDRLADLQQRLEASPPSAALLDGLYETALGGQAMAVVQWLEQAHGRSPSAKLQGPHALSTGTGYEAAVTLTELSALTRPMAEWLVAHVPAAASARARLAELLTTSDVGRDLAEALDVRDGDHGAAAVAPDAERRYHRLTQALVKESLSAFGEMVQQGDADDLDILDLARCVEAYLPSTRVAEGLEVLKARGLWSEATGAVLEAHLVSVDAPLLEAKDRVTLTATLEDAWAGENVYGPFVALRFIDDEGRRFFYRGSAAALTDAAEDFWRSGPPGKRPPLRLSMVASFKSGQLGGKTLPLVHRPSKVKRLTD